MSNGSNNTLIAVPAFATIDEIVSAIVLARVLSATEKETKVQVYLGQRNFPVKLQQLLLPKEDIKFYQPNRLANEFTIKLELQDNNKVKGVRWEQQEDNLNIFIETSDGVEKQPKINIVEKNKFAQVYLLNTKSIRRVEDYDHFAKYTEIDESSIKAVFSTEPAGASKILAEEVLKMAKSRNFELGADDIRLLKIGAYYHKLNSGELLLPQEKSVVFTNTPFEPKVELNADEYRLVNLFWSIETSTNTERELKELLQKNTWRLGDVQALLALTPQLNPLDRSLGIVFKPDANGKKSFFSLIADDKTLYVTDNFEYRPNGKFEYRILDDYIIGYFSEAETQEQNPEARLKQPEIKPTTVPAAFAPKPQPKVEVKPEEKPAGSKWEISTNPEFEPFKPKVEPDKQDKLADNSQDRRQDKTEEKPVAKENKPEEKTGQQANTDAPQADDYIPLKPAGEIKS